MATRDQKTKTLDNAMYQIEKQFGEGAIMPTIPAILNAVYDAIGVRIKDLPITPEKVLAAIKKKLAAAADRAGKDKERAITQAVKKALEEQAAKEGSDE